MEKFMKYIGQIWRCANIYRAEMYEKLDIGPYQDSYILCICNNPGISQEEISKKLYVHKSSVARQLPSLEEKGFVTRMPDARDKRILLVFPTEKALSAITEIRRIHEEWNNMITGGLSENEKEIFCSVCSRIAEKSRNTVGNKLREDNR